MIGKKTLCRSCLSIIIFVNLGIFETAYFVTRILVSGAPNHSGERFQKDAFLGEWLQWFRVDRRSICVKSMCFSKISRFLRITKQKSKLPQISDVFLVMIHSGRLRHVHVVHFQGL